MSKKDKTAYVVGEIHRTLGIVTPLKSHHTIDLNESIPGVLGVLFVYKKLEDAEKAQTDNQEISEVNYE